MNQLVFIKDGEAFTDSLNVAEVFEKRHDNVMQDVKNLDCSEEFSLLNFQESDYTNDRGKTYPKYDMTRDGFTFLAMGYTGKEAARFKEMYIGEFNRMEKQLTIDTQALSPELQMFNHLFEATAKFHLNQVEQAKRITVVEQRQEHITDVLSLNPTEWRKKTKILLDRIAQARDDYADYGAVRKESYQKLEERAGCKLPIRLTNRKRRMALEGASKTRIEKINNLDVIEDDAKLTEIYLAIVKEMAIRHGVEWEEAETCQTSY